MFAWDIPTFWLANPQQNALELYDEEWHVDFFLAV